MFKVWSWSCVGRGYLARGSWHPDRDIHISKWNKYPDGGQVDHATYACIELEDIPWSNRDTDITPMADRLRFGMDLSIVTPNISRGDLISAIIPDSLQVVNPDNIGNFVNTNGKIVYSDNYKYRARWWDCMRKCSPSVESDQASYDRCRSRQECQTLLAEFPDLGLFNGTLDIAFLSSADCRDDITESQDWLISRIGFGPNLPVAKTMSPWGDYKYCYIFGKINGKAGVVRAVFGGNISSQHTVDIERPKELEADRWINYTLKMLPDVLLAMGRYNISVVPRWDNLDNYIKSRIQMAYTATWDSIDQRFSTSRPQVVIKRPAPLVRASVQRRRVYMWLLLSMVFTTGGVLHIVLQRSSSRPAIIDTAANAITTDASGLLNDERIKELNWRNMSYVTKEDVFGSGGAPGQRILLNLKQYMHGFSLIKKDVEA